MGTRKGSSGYFTKITVGRVALIPTY